MTRPLLIRTHLFPYHITTRTNNKEWFEIPLSEVWKMSMHAIKHANEIYPVEVISFVLMQNHYHLIVKTPQSNLDKFMYELNKRLSLLIRTRTKRINSVFGGRYKWSLIRSQTYLYNCYRYVYQNPVRANIVKRCQDYPYSTLHCLIHNKVIPIQLYDTFGFKDEYALHWLNQKINDSEILAIRNGLRKSEVLNLKTRSRHKVEEFNAP